jgi:hypothetical protein
MTSSPIEDNVLLGGRWFDEENDTFMINSKSILETNMEVNNKDLLDIEINDNVISMVNFYNQFPPPDISLPTWIALPDKLDRPPEIWLLEITGGNGSGSSQLIARHPLESYTTMIVLDDTPSFQNNYISINTSYSRNHQQKAELIQENSIYSTSEIQAIVALDPKSCSGTTKRLKLEFHLINCSKINNKNNNSDVIETKVNGKVLVERGSSIVLKAGDRFTLGESTCSYRLVRGQVSDKKGFAAAWDPTVLAATLSQQSIIAKILKDDEDNNNNNNSNNNLETIVGSASEINDAETLLNVDKSNENPNIIINSNNSDLNHLSRDPRLNNKCSSFSNQQEEEAATKYDENNLHLQQIKERDEEWNRKKLCRDSSKDKNVDKKIDIDKGNNSKPFDKKELDLDKVNIKSDRKFSTRGSSRDKTSSKSKNKYNDSHRHNRGGRSRSLSDERDRKERRGRSRDKTSSKSKNKYNDSHSRTRYNDSRSRSTERDRYRKRRDHSKDNRRKSYSRSRSRSYNRYRGSRDGESDRHSSSTRRKSRSVSRDRSKKKNY